MSSKHGSNPLALDAYVVVPSNHLREFIRTSQIDKWFQIEATPAIYITRRKNFTFKIKTRNTPSHMVSTMCRPCDLIKYARDNNLEIYSIGFEYKSLKRILLEKRNIQNEVLKLRKERDETLTGERCITFLKKRVENFTNRYAASFQELLKNRSFIEEKASTGVYFLFSLNECVYVGQSINTTRRIEEHRETKHFDSFTIIDVDKKHLDFVESYYIHTLRPILNGNIEEDIGSFCEKSAPISLKKMLKEKMQ